MIHPGGGVGFFWEVVMPEGTWPEKIGSGANLKMMRDLSACFAEIPLPDEIGPHSTELFAGMREAIIQGESGLPILLDWFQECPVCLPVLSRLFILMFCQHLHSIRKMLALVPGETVGYNLPLASLCHLEPLFLVMQRMRYYCHPTVGERLRIEVTKLLLSRDWPEDGSET